MRNADEGTISVGMIDIAAVHYFPEVLQEFRKEHPLLNFHLRVGSSQPLTQALSSGDLDLAVCVEPKELKSGLDKFLFLPKLSAYINPTEAN